MDIYMTPQMDIVEFPVEDVISTSGIETPPIDDNELPIG